MTLRHVAIALVLIVAAAHSARADKTRVVVLPITAAAEDHTSAAAFDARVLVALEDTGRVTTVTLDEEPECTELKCLADAARIANAQVVLSLSLVHEADGLTVFATLVDSKTAASARRIEVAVASTDDLTSRAPIEVAHRLFGAPAGPAIVGVAERGRVAGAASAISSRLAALNSFTVVPAARPGVTLTHRADINVTDFSITKRRHHVHHYLDGVLVATLTITDLGTNQVVFTKPVKVTISRRDRGSSVAEVSALLVDAAANDWMTAFIAARTEQLLKGDAK
jgi:hypothetical protein